MIKNKKHYLATLCFFFASGLYADEAEIEDYDSEDAIAEYRKCCPEKHVAGEGNSAIGSSTATSVSHGGTGRNSLTIHSVLIGNATNPINFVGPSASTGQVLQNNASADPSYSTATYPSTTTINRILYSSAADTVGQITTANGGTLVTSAAGVPSILAAGATGIPLVSQGAGVQPAFGTALVAGGGTGAATFAALNSLLLSGTTATGAFQQVTGGASGTILTSAGAATAPTYKTLRCTTQTFTSGTGATYTAPTGLVCAVVECVGGGGGAGGCSNSASFASAGGGSGGYSRGVLTAAAITGGTGLYTVGAAGTGGTGNAAGTSGTASNFGGLVIADFGVFSAAGDQNPQSGGAGGALGTVPSGGFRCAGQAGGKTGDNVVSFISPTTVPVTYNLNGGNMINNGTGIGSFTVMINSFSIPGRNPSGAGGSSVYGQGGLSVAMSSSAINGFDGVNFGSGGGGATAGTTGALANGGAGAPGVIIVTEYSLS